MSTFTAQPRVGEVEAPDSFVLAAQDTGKFNLFKIGEELEPVSDGFFNQLGMIYKMEMISNTLDHPDYKFVLGTNNGIAFLHINKNNYAMQLSKEHYLPGKVVNNLLLRGQRVITFVHDSQKFCVIDRKTKEIMDIHWLEN